MQFGHLLLLLSFGLVSCVTINVGDLKLTPVKKVKGVPLANDGVFEKSCYGVVNKDIDYTGRKFPPWAKFAKGVTLIVSEPEATPSNSYNDGKDYTGYYTTEVRDGVGTIDIKEQDLDVTCLKGSRPAIFFLSKVEFYKSKKFKEKVCTISKNQRVIGIQPMNRTFYSMNIGVFSFDNPIRQCPANTDLYFQTSPVSVDIGTSGYNLGLSPVVFYYEQ